MNDMHQPRGGTKPEPLSADDIFGPQPRFSQSERESTLGQASDLFGILRRGKWILLACLLLPLAMAVAYLVRTPPQFTAAAQVVLEPRRLTQQELAGGSTAALDSAQAESQIQVVKSERNLATVFDMLDLAGSADLAAPRPGMRQRLSTFVMDLAGRFFPSVRTQEVVRPEAERLRAFAAFQDRVTVRRVGQSYVLEIAYRAGTAADAARLANSVTAAYVHGQIERKLAAARRGAEFLENRVSSLESEETAAAAAIRDGVMPVVSLPDAESRVISAAREPLGKSFPQTSLVLVFATAIGLLIGGGILAVRHSLDRRVHSGHQVWRALGLPCLAVLPATRRRGLRRLPFDLVVSDARAPFAQGLRTAYTAIVTGDARGTGFRSIGIASWRSGEGKSTVAGNLAHFIAATGEPVRLVDADLQDPTLSEGLAPTAFRGLFEALGDHDELASLQPQPLFRGLGFVPARGTLQPYGPNLFLGAPAVGRFLAQLREGGDVVVDLPAMERSPHTQSVAGFLDGVILVVESGRTTLDEVALAVRRLEASHARLIGVILNKGTSRFG